MLRYKLKPNTKVFAFMDNHFVIGHDMMSDFWSEKYQESFAQAHTLEVPTLHARLKENNFEYLIIGEREIKAFGRTFIENKAGRLSDVTGILADAGINIRALAVADTSDFGVLRLIVDDNAKAEKVLKDSGLLSEKRALPL